MKFQDKFTRGDNLEKYFLCYFSMWNPSRKFQDKFTWGDNLETSSPKGNDCSPDSQHVIIETKV